MTFRFRAVFMRTLHLGCRHLLTWVVVKWNDGMLLPLLSLQKTTFVRCHCLILLFTHHELLLLQRLLILCIFNFVDKVLDLVFELFTFCFKLLNACCMDLYLGLIFFSALTLTFKCCQLC